MQTKYEVSAVVVHTYNGKSAYKKFIDGGKQNIKTLKSFETEEDAKVFYETLQPESRYLNYFLYEHLCTLLEANTYDDEGNQVSSSCLKKDFPDYMSEV